jgi:hypothetical protein
MAILGNPVSFAGGFARQTAINRRLRTDEEEVDQRSQLLRERIRQNDLTTAKDAADRIGIQVDGSLTKLRNQLAAPPDRQNPNSIKQLRDEIMALNATQNIFLESIGLPPIGIDLGPPSIPLLLRRVKNHKPKRLAGQRVKQPLSIHAPKPIAWQRWQASLSRKAFRPKTLRKFWRAWQPTIRNFRAWPKQLRTPYRQQPSEA